MSCFVVEKTSLSLNLLKGLKQFFLFWSSITGITNWTEWNVFLIPVLLQTWKREMSKLLYSLKRSSKCTLISKLMLGMEGPNISSYGQIIAAIKSRIDNNLLGGQYFFKNSDYLESFLIFLLQGTGKGSVTVREVFLSMQLQMLLYTERSWIVLMISMFGWKRMQSK